MYNRAPTRAGIAQLVEHKLPKLGVAGSNPVARSTSPETKPLRAFPPEGAFSLEAVVKVVAPIRVAHSWVQHLNAPRERVFPLLCPVRETEWVEGWDPEVVISASGIAEKDCVFVTGDPKAIWVVTSYEPPVRIEFVKTMPELAVTRISIGLEPEGDDGTAATVRYAHTALSPAGEALVIQMDDRAWQEFTERWETALNRYLAS